MSTTGPMMKNPPAKASNRPVAAFTLIELFIVSVVILILISVSTPLFRKTFSGLELKEAASNISSFITLAQHRAVADGSVCKVVFDYENKTYRLFVASGQEYATVNDRFGRLFHIPANIEIEGAVNEILFYPDGHCDKIEIKLTNKDNETLKLLTTGVMGNVVVAPE